MDAGDCTSHHTGSRLGSGDRTARRGVVLAPVAGVEKRGQVQSQGKLGLPPGLHYRSRPDKRQLRPRPRLAFTAEHRDGGGDAEDLRFSTVALLVVLTPEGHSPWG